MQSISTKPNEPVVPLEVHKLYRPVEFNLTTIYDATKASKNPQGKYTGDAVENNANKENTNQTEINLHWKQIYKVGPGLTNAGNTCFLNSVMQMLTYTSPFANYLLQRKHSIKCPKINNSQFCSLCAFEDHLANYFKNNSKAIKPFDFIKNIKLINKKFQIGRQEDAQEFLRDLVEAFQKSCTGFLEKAPQKVLENTDITKIFGGKLKSTVECKKCHKKTDAIENFFDLSLEISKGDSLEKCMDGFFKPEELVAPNRYRCSHCNRNVDATKKFSIQQRPLVLTIHLKRFENIQGKINKVSRHINFQESLSLKSYMAGQTSESLVYDLQGVIVHVGSLCESGHYYTCVKNSNGIWHQIDDETVKTNKIDLVLKQNAYILTYVLRDDPYKVANAEKQNGITENNLPQGQSIQVDTKKANALIDEIFGKPSSKNSKATATATAAIAKVVVEESKSMPEEKPVIPAPEISKKEPEIQQQEVKKSKKTRPVVSEPTPMVEEEPQDHEEFKSLIKLDVPKKTSIPLLKKSPLMKFKRIATKMIPSLPVKKLKGENKETPVAVPVSVPKEKKNKSSAALDNHQADQQVEEENSKLVNEEAITKKKEKKEYQPLIVGKNIFLTKRGGDKKADATLQYWDAPEDDEEEENDNRADDDEFINMVEERNRIYSENQDFFVTKRKEKDEYDKDYDKGRLKKVKKNKYKEKFNNNFQKAYEFLSRRRRR